MRRVGPPRRIPIAAAALVAIAVAVASGCAAPITATSGVQPCSAVYSADRCDAILSLAAEQLGVADADVSAIEIAPEPTLEPRTDGVLQIRSGGPFIVVLAHIGGDVRQVSICGGVSMEPACRAEQAWTIGVVLGNGYQDVPCPGEPPDGCASPLPSLSPAAIAASSPLRVDRRVIHVSQVGHYEVSLGEATVPNGVLTVEKAELADPWPDGVSIGTDGIRLEVRSLVPGRAPFSDEYEHGWWPGTERVEVFLVFDARRVRPGATIEVVNVVVG